MPRGLVAVVSSDDFVVAVRIYLDRAHDLLRRRGVPPAAAIEQCERCADALLDELVTSPESVGDLAGWWFAQLLSADDASEAASTATAPSDSASLLAGTQGENAVRAALTSLPAELRDAVILRDAYDLPPQAVAVALRCDLDEAAERTAQGRLQLVAAYDSRAAPDLDKHTGRTTVDVPTLSRLAEGSLPSPRAAPLRRHAANCEACEDVIETLAKGRRLATGLPVIAIPEETRDELLDRVGQRTAKRLPNTEQLARTLDEVDNPRPAVPPLAAVMFVVIALVLGVATALMIG